MTDKSTNRQAGFTIVELLISTTVFSVILLVASFAVIQIGRTYYKGAAQTRVQEAARVVVDDIAQSIQFSGGNIVATPAAQPPAGVSTVFCINDVRYTYQLDRRIVSESPDSAQSESYHALVADNASTAGCNSGLTPHDFGQQSIAGARELLGENMRLAKFEVRPVGSNLYTIAVKIVYGPDDVLEAAHDTCVPDSNSSQYCAISELTTTVQKRLN